MPTKPKIYLMIPPPAYTNSYDGYKLNLAINDEVFPRLIPAIGKDLGLKSRHVIDLYEVMGGKDRTEFELFCDGQACDHIHPNHSGYSVIASTVFGAIFGPIMNIRKN